MGGVQKEKEMLLAELGRRLKGRLSLSRIAGRRNVVGGHA